MARPGNVGVPIKLLYEAEGMKITVEVSNKRALHIRKLYGPLLTKPQPK